MRGQLLQPEVVCGAAEKLSVTYLGTGFGNPSPTDPLGQNPSPV